MERKITNTEKQERHIFDAMPGMIEASEARGQSELVASTQLPTEIRPPEGKKTLEEAGVKFGEPNEEDPLFCEATLPEGWKKVATEHSMWSELVDDKGVKRASIFYKAAFYDRAAFMNVE